MLCCFMCYLNSHSWFTFLCICYSSSCLTLLALILFSNLEWWMPSTIFFRHSISALRNFSVSSCFLRVTSFLTTFGAISSTFLISWTRTFLTSSSICFYISTSRLCDFIWSRRTLASITVDFAFSSFYTLLIDLDSCRYKVLIRLLSN